MDPRQLGDLLDHKFDITEAKHGIYPTNAEDPEKIKIDPLGYASDALIDYLAEEFAERMSLRRLVPALVTLPQNQEAKIFVVGRFDEAQSCDRLPEFQDTLTFTQAGLVDHGVNAWMQYTGIAANGAQRRTFAQLLAEARTSGTGTSFRETRHPCSTPHSTSPLMQVLPAGSETIDANHRNAIIEMQVCDLLINKMLKEMRVMFNDRGLLVFREEE